MRNTLPSSFDDELTRAVEKWLPYVPEELREAFVTEFRALAVEHDRQLDIIAAATMRGYASNIRDEVTGLVRRRYCLDYLRGLLSVAPPPSLPALGMVLLDLDDFKPINDTYGHGAGDRALAAIGGILKAAIRIERGTDVLTHVPMDGVDPAVARAGGDEFIALLPLKDPEDILPVTQRISRRVNDRDRQRAHGYDLDRRLVASIGGLACDLRTVPTGLTVDALVDRLIRLVDQEMYRSKSDRQVHVALVRFTDGAEMDVRDLVTLPTGDQVRRERPKAQGF